MGGMYRIAAVIVTIVLSALFGAAITYAALATTPDPNNVGYYTLDVGACRATYASPESVQPFRTLAWACTGDAVRVWPLPLQSPWYEFAPGEYEELEQQRRERGLQPA